MSALAREEEEERGGGGGGGAEEEQDSLVHEPVCELACEDSSKHRNHLPGFLWLAHPPRLPRLPVPGKAGAGRDSVRGWPGWRGSRTLAAPPTGGRTGSTPLVRAIPPAEEGNDPPPQSTSDQEENPAYLASLHLGWSQHPEHAGEEVDYALCTSLADISGFRVLPFLDVRQLVSYRISFAPPFLPDLVGAKDPTARIRLALAPFRVAVVPSTSTEGEGGEPHGGRAYTLRLLAEAAASDYLALEMLEAPASPSMTATSSLTFSLLESFSLLTRRARGAANAVLETPVAKPLVPLMPVQVRQTLLPPGTEVEEWAGVGHFISVVGEEMRRFRRPGALASPAGAALPVLERLPFALAPEPGIRQLHFPLSPELWTQWMGEGEDPSSRALRVHTYLMEHGMQPALRPTVWPYLLDVLGWKDTAQERKAKMEQASTSYRRQVQAWRDVLGAQTQQQLEGSAHPSLRHRSSSINAGDEAEGGDPVDKLRERIHRIEKDVIRTDRNHDLLIPTSHEERGSNESISTSLLSRDPESPSKQITGLLADLREILVTYVHADDLGYVQGMNDLAIVFVRVFEGQVELAFACFHAFMSLHSRRFARNQLEMKRCLDGVMLVTKLMDPSLHVRLEAIGGIPPYFLYRALLLLFKRDFASEPLLHLWDYLLARRQERLDLLVAATLLSLLRDKIRGCGGFDDLITLFNHLEGLAEVEGVLPATRAYARAFQTRLADLRAAEDWQVGRDGGRRGAFAAWTEAERQELLSLMTPED